MKLLVRDNIVIKLPDLETVDGGLTRDVKTSFLDEFKTRLTKSGDINREEKMRAYVLDKIQKSISGDYQSYFEPLGGVGVTASMFMSEEVDVTLNELDDACLQTIRTNFPGVTTTKQDMFKYEYTRNFDVIFFDYNNYTLAKFHDVYNETTKNAFAHSDKYVIINDCSVFYLNRGAKSFQVYSKLLGEEVTNFDEFFHALKRFYKKQFPEWDLVRVDRFYASSYLKFQKGGDKDLELYFHDTKDEAASPILKIEKGKPRFRFW